MRRLLATACGDAAVTNGYTDDLLSTLTHTNTSGKTTTYSFVYGAADLQTAVNIGSRNLVSNAYNSGTWTLSSQTYGNGDYWKYFYDNMGTLTSRFTNCSDNEGIGFYYTYNGKGNLVRIEMKSVTIADGAVTGGTLLSSENYLYDGSDRLIRVVETDGDNVVLHDFSWTYDAKDNITSLTEKVNGMNFAYNYSYDDDGRPTNFNYRQIVVDTSYDSHGRVSGRAMTKKSGSEIITTTYGYRDVDDSHTTTQVTSVHHKYNQKTADFTYTYDANGNIATAGIDGKTTTYEYDDLGQLVWEKNATAGKAWNYTYDNGGNILSRTEYTCSSSGKVSGSGTTTSYTYGDAEWGDLLTAYNGEEITYDGIGNPLSYHGWAMSWQGGRQLAFMTKGSNTLNFAYNESGLRTSKTVNGVTHSYVWQGSKLAADITDAYALYFHYDSTGNVIGFTRTADGTNTDYVYLKNLQGDIIKVLTSNRSQVAAYTYDAWGRVLTSTGDLAEINPLRYRGYFYDTETGLYYLKSRYYDPEVGRFINPDAFASTGQGILGANMFAYCNNSPVVLTDATGSLSELGSKILGVAFGVFCGAVAAAVVISVAPAAVCALSVGLASWGVSSAAAATIAEVAIFVVGANAAVYGADSGYSAVTGESPMLEAFGGNEDVYETWQIASATSIYGVGALGQYGAQAGVCFIAGTLIAAADGQTPIEDIEPGDLVWAWDEETEDVSLKSVVETYVNETDELIHLTVNGEEIVSTPNHPFYSPVKGWTAACKLRAGDILVLVNGDYVVLEKVQHELLESPIRVYNFHVADYHTYFVGEDCVLVHNSCNHNGAWARERRNYWKAFSEKAELNADYISFVATPENIDRMKRGVAPIGWDGFAVHLHHWLGIAVDFFDYSPVSRTVHQILHMTK